ncbi:MAG: hypothetical protein AAGI53_08895 [Planctomycetota bacterium]
MIRSTASTLAAGLALSVFGPASVLGQDAEQPQQGDAPAAAQETTAEVEPFDPRAVEIFERHIEALGGRDVIYSVDKRILTGTYEGSPLQFPGRLKMVFEAPDKMYWQISEPAGISVKTVYNGERGWRAVQQGFDTQTDWIIGPTLVDLIESASFYGEADYENRYKELRLVGTADFYGSSCYVIRGVRNSGKLHLLMFDSSTNIYAGARTAVLHQSGEVRPMDVRITSWQTVDGVMVPDKMVQQFRGEPASNVFTMSRIRHEADPTVDWNPPETLPSYPELDENFMPKMSQTSTDAEPAEAP